MKTNGVRAHLLFLLSFTVVTSGWADLAIMPVGDSITEGAHSNCGGYRYPLYVFLTKAGIGIHFVGQSSSNCSSLPMDMRHHNGYSGADISDIQNNLFGNPGAKTMEMCVPNQGGYWMTNGEDSGKAVIPDVILLMIGTNNILHHPQDADPKNFEPLYKNLVAWFLKNRPNAQIFVATIAPITRKPPHQLDAVNEFNKWLKEVAPNWGANCHIVDINAVLSNSDGTPNEKLLADGCHPNQAGYDLLGEAWGNAVEDLVSKGTLKKDTPATLEASLFALPAGKQSPIPGVGSISPSTSAAAAGSTLTISGNVTAGNCRMTAPVLTIQLTGDKKPSVAAEPTQTLGNIAPHATVPFKIEIKVPGNCDAGGYCIGAAAKSPEGTAAITYGPKVNVTK